MNWDIMKKKKKKTTSHKKTISKKKGAGPHGPGAGKPRKTPSKATA